MIANLASPSPWSSPAAIPALLQPAGSAPKRQLDWTKALQVARAAALAVHPRNCLKRVAYLLCELASHADDLRRGEIPVPLSRERLAEALGINLPKVKRTVALLSLSRVIHCDGRGIRVLDWRRLGATAGFDRARMGETDELEEPVAPRHDAPAAHLLTTTGDPAYFG